MTDDRRRFASLERCTWSIGEESSLCKAMLGSIEPVWLRDGTEDPHH